MCFIVPSHILMGIANSEHAEPEAKEHALSALHHSRSLRAHRMAQATSFRDQSAESPSEPPMQGIVPPHILRAVASSEEVPPESRAAAAQTLEHSNQIRMQRQAFFSSAAPSSEKRMLYTCNQTRRLPGTLVRAESKPPASDAAINQVYDAFGYTFEFYQKIFARNSIDDKGLSLIGSVHYDKKYDNAMWNGQQMVFGDGDGVYFATGGFTKQVDVIGHELTHGVTQYTANLDYQGQSGALNESCSDVFGIMVKQYHLNQKSSDANWLIGEGIWAPKINGVALRSMKAPGTAYNDPKVGGKDPQPATMADFVTTTEDEGGVHLNSGIPNHAFYLVAVALGGYSWERAGKIWYQTLTGGELANDADFKAFADLTVQNAGKLFDQSVADVVTKAWKDVGVY
jgi:Zn-dependent metalloprotease